MFVALLALGAATDPNKEDCNDSEQKVGACKVKLHECGGIYDWNYKYDADAKASGKDSKTGGDHYDSKDGAAYHAIYKLFNKMGSTFDDDDCSCQHQDTRKEVHFPRCCLR